MNWEMARSTSLMVQMSMSLVMFFLKHLEDGPSPSAGGIATLLSCSLVLRPRVA